MVPFLCHAMMWPGHIVLSLFKHNHLPLHTYNSNLIYECIICIKLHWFVIFTHNTLDPITKPGVYYYNILGFSIIQIAFLTLSATAYQITVWYYKFADKHFIDLNICWQLNESNLIIYYHIKGYINRFAEWKIKLCD